MTWTFCSKDLDSFLLQVSICLYLRLLLLRYINMSRLLLLTRLIGGLTATAFTIAFRRHWQAQQPVDRAVGVEDVLRQMFYRCINCCRQYGNQAQPHRARAPEAQPLVEHRPVAVVAVRRACTGGRCLVCSACAASSPHPFSRCHRRPVPLVASLSGSSSRGVQRVSSRAHD